MKDGAYAVNLDEYPDIGTHWIALHALNNNFTYFEDFVVEHIPTEIINSLEIRTERKIFLENKHMIQ